MWNRDIGDGGGHHREETLLVRQDMFKFGKITRNIRTPKLTYEDTKRKKKEQKKKIKRQTEVFEKLWATQ